MSHYILHLPTGEQADVRQGYIFRKSLSPWAVFSRKSWVSERKKGYMIVVGGARYQLLRSMDGTWLNEAEGNFRPSDDSMAEALKEAIAKYENSH